ncbi:HpsJ family protein [Synechococcus sp. 1G10]|uniref:HpsJ family protein n=1 Tax=Synechococcus sp. 1G10 TaxID=2025605 RepID=UPI0013035F2A|nr:HpsJ family protein [Synechococcus sp. 1G10]
MEIDFTSRRGGSLARIAAYTFLLIFLLNLLTIFLPPPFLDPERTFSSLVELVERSTLPLVAVLFLFFGLTGEALPALWECRLARLFRPLLLVAALLYLVTTFTVVAAAQRIEATGIANSKAQIERSKGELEQLRNSLLSGSNDAALQRVLSSQPGLAQALQQQGGGNWAELSMAERRKRVEQLIDTSEVNLARQAMATRANASGKLRRQTLLTGLTAFLYTLFFLSAHLIWPRSLAATRERIFQAREARLAEDP